MNLTNKYFVPYQIAVLILFLVMVTKLKTLDYALPAYIVLSTLVFFKSFRTLPDAFCLLVVLVSASYLLYGIVVQDAVAAITSFCTRIYQFLVVLLFYKNSWVLKVKIQTGKIILTAVTAETIIGIYLLLSGGMTSENGLTRVVAGNQPVGGNLTIALLPVFIWMYFHDVRRRKIIIFGTLYLLIWIVFSGTRGYLLLFLCSMLLIYSDYILHGSKTKKEAVEVVLFLALVLIAGIVVFWGNGGRSINAIRRVLRLNVGTGRRDRENAIALLTFQKADLKYKLLGIGLGGAASTIAGYEQTVFSVWGGKWGYYRYINAVGAPFHCLYTNILLLQGILGSALLSGVFIWGAIQIKISGNAVVREKLSIFLFWIGFFVMNYFRWSCDCGCAEMIFFAIVLNKISGRKYTSR